MDTDTHCNALASSGYRCSCPEFTPEEHDDEMCECGHDIDEHEE